MASDVAEVEGDSPPPVQIDYRDPPPRRKPISFVSATSSSSSRATSTNPKPAISQDYLSLVLPAATASTSVHEEAPNAVETCEICNLPLSSNLKCHQTSTSHQVCLQHTHVPSSIDRSRKGLQYLQAYGFDPDARTGLGSSKSGIVHPVKAVEKKGKEGIGAVPKVVREQKERVKKLGPKEIAKKKGVNRKRDEQLQRMFYSSGELEKYLGPNA